MGRLLNIARQTRGTLRPSPSPTEADWNTPAVNSPPLPPISVLPPQDLPTAAVMALIAEAQKPVPHSVIVKTLVEREHGKGMVRQAIAWCQKNKQIEHDLVAGYVLPHRVY